MINVNYSIWLQEALGVGSRLSDIFSVFSSAEEIYLASDKLTNELELSGVLTEKQIYKLRNTKIANSYKVIETCAALGIDILTPDSAQYPEGLLELRNFPAVLYVKGSLQSLRTHIPLAIVGTRKPSDYSRIGAQNLSMALSKSGFVIVSGGALGIDTAAHTGALLAGGKTIAVLGCGIGADYLRDNEALRNIIAAEGALISEHPPKALPYKGSFPIRNRLIAAMTYGTVVAEAGVKSGSLITSKAAYEYNKDVFVIPAPSVGTSNLGSEELIRDGAKPVHSAMDVVEEYVLSFPNKVIINGDVDLKADIVNAKSTLQTLNLSNSVKVDTEAKEKRELAGNFSEEARKVYECFGSKPLSIDDVVEAVIMPTNSTLGALTELEVFGYIELLPNAKYFLK